MINQSLRGLVGQSLSTRKASTSYSKTFPASTTTYTWVVPAGGTYEVAAWGCGAVSNQGISTATGSFALKTVQLGAGQRVSIAVGNGVQSVTTGGSGGGSNTNTTVTFPDGKVMTAGSSSLGVVGAATGGDVNIAPTTGTDAGVAAPSYATQYNSYVGGGAASIKGFTPGGATGTPIGTMYGSDGLVIINRIA